MDRGATLIEFRNHSPRSWLVGTKVAQFARQNFSLFVMN